MPAPQSVFSYDTPRSFVPGSRFSGSVANTIPVQGRGMDNDLDLDDAATVHLHDDKRYFPGIDLHFLTRVERQVTEPVDNKAADGLVRLVEWEESGHDVR